jgi:hypothetical protein
VIEAAGLPPLRVPHGLFDSAERLMAGLVIAESLRAWAENEVKVPEHAVPPLDGVVGIFDTRGLVPGRWERLFLAPFDERALTEALRFPGAVRLVVMRGSELAPLVRHLHEDIGAGVAPGRLAITGPVKPNRSGNVLALVGGRWEAPGARKRYAVVLDGQSAMASTSLPKQVSNEIPWELANPPRADAVVPLWYTLPQDCRRLIIRCKH